MADPVLTGGETFVCNGLNWLGFYEGVAFMGLMAQPKKVAKEGVRTTPFA